MAWPTNANNIVTTNLDAGTDSPASARADLKAALDEITNIINGRGEASGVAPLDSASKIAATYLPNEINSESANNLTLDPATNVVKVEDIIQLETRTTAQLNAQSGLAEGMIAFCSDAGPSSGEGIPVYFTGGQWRSMIDGTNI
jgi:hypothetical protein